MKKNLIPMAAAFAMVGFIACNGPDDTTQDTSAMTTTENHSGTTHGEEGTSTAGHSSDMASSSFDENASYVDLNSGKSVKLKKDASSGYVTNQQDNTPILFYYNPVTNDTFNREGRVVNNYLMRSPTGTYSLDEKKWKTKIDEDGDFKAKDGNETKIKVDGNEPEVKIKTEDTKIKADENSYKMKGPDGKVKSTDDKTKTKSSGNQ